MTRVPAEVAVAEEGEFQKMKHLYKAEVDIKVDGRWLVHYDTVSIVANGDLRKAINKSERVAKKAHGAQAARCTSIQRVSSVDAV